MAYLEHDPTQRTQYDPLLHYGDWARERGLPETGAAGSLARTKAAILFRPLACCSK